MSKGYRLPSQMHKKDEREPVSTRIKTKSIKVLKKASKSQQMSLSTLLANVLEDYADWLSKQKKN